MSAAESSGRLSICEMLVPHWAGAPYHLHHTEDEFFFVVSGAIEFTLDGRQVTAQAGDAVFGPHGFPHCFRAVAETPSRLLTISSPGGLDRFFADVFRHLVGAQLPTPDVLIPLYRRHDMCYLGPSPVFPPPSNRLPPLSRLVHRASTQPKVLIGHDMTTGRMAIETLTLETNTIAPRALSATTDRWLYVLDGEGQLTDGDLRQPFLPGDSCWLPAGCHRVVEHRGRNPIQLLVVRF